MTEKPTHLAKGASHTAQTGLRHARSGNPGCIGLSDAWTFNVHLGDASPNDAAVFSGFRLLDRVNHYIFRPWGLRGVCSVKSVPPSSALLSWELELLLFSLL